MSLHRRTKLHRRAPPPHFPLRRGRGQVRWRLNPSNLSAPRITSHSHVSRVPNQNSKFKIQKSYQPRLRFQTLQAFMPHRSNGSRQKNHPQSRKQAMALAEKSVRIGWTYADAFKNVRKRLWFKDPTISSLPKTISAPGIRPPMLQFAEILISLKHPLPRRRDWLSTSSMSMATRRRC